MAVYDINRILVPDAPPEYEDHKPMGIAGEEDERVVDGVGFLRRVNAGERPEMPETVVVVGGGDVAMDACRVAKRLPGCKHVKVIYRRGPGEIPARKIELHHAIKEDVEFLYHTQQVAVVPRGNQLALQCVKGMLRFARGVGRGYIGQSNQVTVPLGGAVDREKYGYFHDDVPAEIVNLRVLGELMN